MQEQHRSSCFSTKHYVVHEVTSPTAAIRIFIPNKDIVDTVGCTAGVVNGRKIRAFSLSYEFNSNPLVFHTK